MRLPGAFDSGSNVLSSTLMDCELSVNCRPASGQVGTPKVPKGTFRTPGLRFRFSVGSDPVTCLFQINSRAFGASGTTFFEFFEDSTFIVRGALTAPDADFPIATMCSNGTAGDQVFITSGGDGFIFTLSTNTLAAIADLDFPNGSALMGRFFEGYFLVLVANSREFRWSALEDGTSWDALDVAQRSWRSDDITFLEVAGTHFWLVGNRTSEIWYATGGIEVFAPGQEALIEHGSVASFSCALIPQGIVCLDQDDLGVGQIIVFRGLTPDSVSTYAINIEQQARDGFLQNAVGFAVQIDGHVDYILTNGTGTFRLTPCFDFTENLWHHRAHWDPSVADNPPEPKWIPYRPWCHVAVFQRHWVGDRLTGAVYDLSMSAFTDELAAV